MRRVDLSKVLLLAAVTVLVACWANGRPVAAQEKKAEGKAAAQKKERAKPRGRLPAFFAAVVTKDQREEIYAIQAKFNAQIEKLQQQLAALRAERDKAIDAVLTPEQLAEVNKKREEAAKRRSSRRSKKSGSQ